MQVRTPDFRSSSSQSMALDGCRDSDPQTKPAPKRRARPQSLMAQNFSASLDQIFQMNDDIVSITNEVDRKRQSVSLQALELRSLEARLKEMDERLLNSVPGTRADTQRAPASPFSFDKIENIVFSSSENALPIPRPYSVAHASPLTRDRRSTLGEIPQSSNGRRIPLPIEEDCEAEACGENPEHANMDYTENGDHEVVGKPRAMSTAPGMRQPETYRGQESAPAAASSAQTASH